MILKLLLSLKGNICNYLISGKQVRALKVIKEGKSKMYETLLVLLCDFVAPLLLFSLFSYIIRNCKLLLNKNIKDLDFEFNLLYFVVKGVKVIQVSKNICFMNPYT